MRLAQRMTADEYLAMTPDRRHTELIGGEFVVDQPTFRHQPLVNEINFALATWTRAAPDRGVVVLPLDVKIDAESVLAPDLLWYAAARVPADEDWPYPLPDLAVEVRSPSTWCSSSAARRRGRSITASRWSWDAATRSHRRCCPGSRSRSTRCSLADPPPG